MKTCCRQYWRHSRSVKMAVSNFQHARTRSWDACRADNQSTPGAAEICSFWLLSVVSLRRSDMSEILFNDPLVIIAGPSHSLARRRTVDVAELVQHAWTLQPADNLFAAITREAFRDLGLDRSKITVETTSANLRRKLLATGLFLSMTPRSLVLFPRKDPAFKILPVALPRTSRPAAIITLKDRSLNPAAQLFIEQVRTLTKPLAAVR